MVYVQNIFVDTITSFSLKLPKMILFLIKNTVLEKHELLPKKKLLLLEQNDHCNHYKNFCLPYMY